MGATSETLSLRAASHRAMHCLYCRSRYSCFTLFMVVFWSSCRSLWSSERARLALRAVAILVGVEGSIAISKNKYSGGANGNYAKSFQVQEMELSITTSEKRRGNSGSKPAISSGRNTLRRAINTATPRWEFEDTRLEKDSSFLPSEKPCRPRQGGG